MCFFFKQKTAYEMRISDWSSDVCSSDLLQQRPQGRAIEIRQAAAVAHAGVVDEDVDDAVLREQCIDRTGDSGLIAQFKAQWTYITCLRAERADRIGHLRQIAAMQIDRGAGGRETTHHLQPETACATEIGRAHV